MNGKLGKCLGFAAAVTVAMAMNLTKLEAKDVEQVAYHPVITVSEGTVMVMGMKYSVWEPAPVGTLLLSGDKVKTGWGSRAEIRFLSGTVKLYENSLLIVPSIGVQDRKKDIQDIVVEGGDVLFDINPLGLQRQFEFETKNVQGGVKGTVFLVSYINEGTTINVFRGTVWASQRGHGKNDLKVINAGNAVRAENGKALGELHGFDPEFNIEDYKYNIPSGLDGQTRLPADYNANPDNKGVRKRPDKTDKILPDRTDDIPPDKTDKIPPGLEKKIQI